MAPVDRAEIEIERTHERNLAAAHRPPGPAFTGACLYCGTPIEIRPVGQLQPRWCNADCRDLWQQEQDQP